MRYGKKCNISSEKKEEYIGKLLPQLSILRAQAGLSQDEISNLVGISRQTYCLNESCTRSMSWNTYLSVIMFFDYNMKTHDMLHRSGVFPDELFYFFNPEEEEADAAHLFEKIPQLNSMFDSLDENGKNAVRMALVAEYARCGKMSKEKTVNVLVDVIQ